MIVVTLAGNFGVGTRHLVNLLEKRETTLATLVPAYLRQTLHRPSVCPTPPWLVTAANVLPVTMDDYHPEMQHETAKRLHTGALPWVLLTQSPFVLDAVRAASPEIPILVRGPQGHLRALAEHPQWPRLEGALSPGEFWTSVGEAWVTGDEETKP